MKNKLTHSTALIFDPHHGSYFQYSHIISETVYTKNNISTFQEILNSISLKDSYPNRIIHIFYEYSFVLIHRLDLISNDKVLAIIQDFSQKKPIKFSCQSTALDQKIDIYLNTKEYQKIFEKGKKHLFLGNVYQFNLTTVAKKNLSPSQNLWPFIKLDPYPSPYFFSTYIKTLNQYFICNTPEILFQVNLQDFTLISQPIKGTHPSKIQLLKQAKNTIELTMITDLICNDLNKLNPYKCIVEKKIELMQVPLLWHLYSKLSLPLKPEQKLWNIIDCLFPGGSITGCPKIKSIELLHSLEKTSYPENFSRGLYTGTSIFWREKELIGTINIRLAQYDINSNDLYFFGGGGITTLSDSQDEFQEAILKIQSLHSRLELIGQSEFFAYP